VIVEVIAGLYLFALVVKTTNIRIRLNPDMSSTVQGLIWGINHSARAFNLYLVTFVILFVILTRQWSIAFTLFGVRFDDVLIYMDLVLH